MDSQARLTDALQADPRIAFAYLFGSHAAGRPGRRSDVDVGVWLRDDPGPATRLEIAASARAALRRNDVDVVVINTAPLTLAFETLRGRLLFSRDEELRVVAEAGLMSRYHDRVHAIRRHLTLATEHIREHGYR